MNQQIPTIPVARLAIAFVPVLIVLFLQFRWSVSGAKTLYALARMLLQLALIGYVLKFLFDKEDAFIVTVVLMVMLGAASWISLHTVHQGRWRLLPKALLAVSAGGVPTLIVVTQFVLDLVVWYQPRFVIPLAGMIFASAMNSVSLAAERYEAETRQGRLHDQARRTALNAALIPITNSLFAVGLVSLPGMMTGQILGGAEPLVAARYQVMVMAMLFGAAGISAACYLKILPRSGAETDSMDDQ